LFGWAVPGAGAGERVVLGGEIWDEPVRGETFPPHLLGLSGIGQLRLFLEGKAGNGGGSGGPADRCAGGFVLARAAAGLSDGTIASDVLHLEQVRAWFGRPLWDMEAPDADAYFGKVCATPPRAPGCRGPRRSRPTSCSSLSQG